MSEWVELFGVPAFNRALEVLTGVFNDWRHRPHEETTEIAVPDDAITRVESIVQDPQYPLRLISQVSLDEYRDTIAAVTERLLTHQRNLNHALQQKAEFGLLVQSMTVNTIRHEETAVWETAAELARLLNEASSDGK